MTPSPTYADLSVGAFVWVLLTMYIVFVLSLAIYGYLKTAKLATLRLKIDDHFVASRSLGLTVLAFTVFATVFSGYTVVGVPGEVWALGYFGFRWLFTTSLMGYPMIFMASRMYTLGKARNYVSATDFIKDRYGSWCLTWFTSLAMVFPAVAYAMAQFISMGATIQGMSDGKLDDFHAASILCVVMVIYEIFGGLRAIAYTDVVQGTVLVLGFLLFYIAQEDIFGGVEDANRIMATLGKNVILKKDWVRSWVGFGMMVCISYAFYPQIIIRTYAAKNATVLKWTYVLLLFGTWLAMTCSMFTGMVANLYPSDYAGMNTVFGVVVRRVISENAGYNILGSVMLTASVAAFMSTADSAINACVSLITLDILTPMIPNTVASKEKIIFYGGKLISVATALAALFGSQTDLDMGALLTLQGMVLCQVAPAFILGFFNLNLHPYPIFMGQFVGVVISIGYQCASEYCIKSSLDVLWFGPVEGIQPGFFALVMNILVAWGGSCVFSAIGFKRFAFDKVDIEKFNDDIPQDLLRLGADGTSRPWNTFPWNILFLLAFILHCFTTPWWNDFESPTPDLDAGSFPTWVWGCGLCRLFGDILVIIAVVFGWQDDEDKEITEKEVELGTTSDKTADL